MKIMFVLSLLINIVFFLWEFNINATNIGPIATNGSEKQILLVSELPKKQPVEQLVENEIETVVSELTAIFPAVPENTIGNDIQYPAMAEIDSELPQSLQPVEIDENKIPAVVLENKQDVKVAQENTIEESLVSSIELNPELPVLEKRICYQIGPFANNDAIEAWANLNSIKPEMLKIVKKDRQVVSSHLVYYPAAKQYQQSKKNVGMLKGKGITDLWLFRKGEMRGAISLGLFVKESRALSLKRNLLKKGINVDVLQRYKTETFWDVQALADKDSLTIYDGLLSTECKKPL